MDTKEVDEMKSKFADGKEIERLRGARSQKDFADLIGLQQNSISAFELGKIEPSSETWAKIGNIAPYPDNIACWKRAGIDGDKMLSAAEGVWKERTAPPSASEGVRVPCVRLAPQMTENEAAMSPLAFRKMIESPQRMESTGEMCLLPIVKVPNPLSTDCLEVDEATANPTLRLGDLVAFDKSQGASRVLRPFWDNLVLVDIDGRRSAGSAPAAHVLGHGRAALCMGYLRCQRVGPPLEQLNIGSNLRYQATLVWHSEPAGVTADKHTKIVIGEWRSRLADLSHRSLRDFETKTRQQVLNEMECEKGCFVLGRVVAYYAAPSATGR